MCNCRDQISNLSVSREQAVSLSVCMQARGSSEQLKFTTNLGVYLCFSALCVMRASVIRRI